MGRRESGIGGPDNKLWERLRWESLGREWWVCKLRLWSKLLERSRD